VIEREPREALAPLGYERGMECPQHLAPGEEVAWSAVKISTRCETSSQVGKRKLTVLSALINVNVIYKDKDMLLLEVE